MPITPANVTGATLAIFDYRCELRLLNWVSPEPRMYAILREAQPRLDPDKSIWNYYRNLR